jgi:hypothetical protein
MACTVENGITCKQDYKAGFVIEGGNHIFAIYRLALLKDHRNDVSEGAGTATECGRLRCITRERRPIPPRSIISAARMR